MIFELYVSYWENTLSCGQGKVQMSFWRNWAVSIGGFLIFPAVNAILAFNLPAFTSFRWCLAVVGGFLVTAALYMFWWTEGKGNKGHILYWKSKQGHQWGNDVTGAGWVHFLYMIVQISILFAYIFNPMGRPVVIAVGSLFAAYVIVVILQAHYIQKNLKWSAAIGEMLAVVAITAIKWW